MENEFKGTKGKWNVSHNSQGYNSFHINSKYKLVHESEEIANAQLISKAPEMLEMLKELVSYLEAIHGAEDTECVEMINAKNLIKEATTI